MWVIGYGPIAIDCNIQTPNCTVSSLSRPIPIIWDWAATLHTLRTTLYLGFGCSTVFEAIHFFRHHFLCWNSDSQQPSWKMSTKGPGLSMGQDEEHQFAQLTFLSFCLLGTMILKSWFFHLFLVCPWSRKGLCLSILHIFHPWKEENKPAIRILG